MSNLLNRIVSNNSLFIGIIVLLSIILIVLIVLIVRSLKANRKINVYEEELEDEDIKKVKDVKKEDIIESPEEEIVEKNEDKEEKKEEPEELTHEEKVIEEKITEEEIKERYDEEHDKEVENIKEETTDTVIEELIKEMEEESKIKPEDVVKNFEKEQEAQSIISYKELVNAVKSRNETDYEDALEQQPLATVSDFVKEDEKTKTDTENILKEITKNVEMNTDDEIEELLPIDDEVLYQEKKFKKTDIISPIYGIVPENNTDEKIDEEIEETVDTTESQDIDLSEEQIDVSSTALNDIFKHMKNDYVKENDIEDSSALDELTKNEEFLQSLKDFRKKL